MTTQQIDDGARAPASPEVLDLLAQAEAARGEGPEALTAVLQAVLAADALGAEAVTPHVTRLWFTPWRFPAGEHVLARESAWLEPTTPVALRVAGRDLAGFTAGSGPTVLLVHGWGDHAARLGAFVAPLARNGWRVLGVDLPGHGSSAAGATDLYEWIDALRELIANEDVQAVVAHSLGGQAVVQALQGESGVRAAALLAPAVRFEHSLAAFASMFSLPATALVALRREIERRYGRGVFTALDADHAAQGLRLPALIVHSADDEQVSGADAQLLASTWPGARLISVDGLGHARVLRDATVVDTVAEFVTAQAGLV